MSDRECFVVMPFGSKPFPDGSGRTYDFEKVYRVLIQRAVRESGMLPVRADERLTSSLIHSDMFRDLRDRAVVLADLSLDNPNVFYELGVRHVMRAHGTVLICRRGASLPFDVSLSRVIFYSFDGTSLDWEEVEQVVKQIKVALQEARRGQPDSPVHALLEPVMPRPGPDNHNASALSAPERAPDAEPLAKYQTMLARCWASANESPETLFEKHRDAVFALRALAYWVCETDPMPKFAKRLANQLNDAAQYRLANQVYARLQAASGLSLGSLLAYASSYSEEHPNQAGAERAITWVKEAIERIQREPRGDAGSARSLAEYGHAYRRLAGLYQWKWQLTHDGADLDLAIATFAEAIRYSEQARERGAMGFPGFLAQSRLKVMLLLRIRDQSAKRADTERHRDAILALQAREGDDPKGISYLGWFQAITLADMGVRDQAEHKALTTLVEDGKLANRPDYWEIGRRQYVSLRRFLEQFGSYLRHPSLVGRISQILQASTAT